MIKEEWWIRLNTAINDSGRSLRDIALSAGLGPNYIGQMRKHGKMPGADAVLKLCRALNVSAIYIFTGAKMSPEAEELLDLFSRLSRDQQDRFLDLLRSLRADEAA